MNYKKTVLVISFLAVCGFLFNFGLPAVKAMTNAEIQALIAQLQAQIAALQQQLNQQPTDVAWCYTFNNNLRIGETSQEVLSLQQALSKEGIYEITMAEDGYFGEVTASAVVEFQEKYASEILTPVGLRHGNGFVGKLTRTKLNNLYGCGATPATPFITVTSPNGGEILREGSNYKITWDASNLPSDAKISITLFRTGESNMLIASNLPSTQREYSWQVTDSGDWAMGYEYKPSLFARIFGIQEVEAAGYSYQITVSASWGNYGTNYYGNIYDRSNGWFYIDSSDYPSITVTSPNGGEVWKIGEYKDIKFNVSGVPKVKIFLKDYSKQTTCQLNEKEEILNFAAGSNPYYSFSFTVGSGKCSVLPGDKFKIEVYYENDLKDEPAVYDYSDNYFSIVAAPAVSCIDSDGRDYHTKGSSTGVFVGMKYYPETTTVTDFCLGSIDPNTLVEYYCKDNYIYSENFNCPSGCQDGACKSVPSVTVLSPNGGEQFTAGSQMVVRWQNTNYRDSVVNLFLYRSNTIPGESDYNFVEQIGSLAQTNDGTETWTIPATVTQGSNYFIRVNLDVKDPEGGFDMVDDSDAPFSIVAAPTIACTDSDGDNIYTKGTVVSKSGTYTDLCWGDGAMTEYTCSANDVFAVANICSYGCSGGACKSASSITVSSNPKADTGGNLTIVKGSQLAITGSPSNISGTLNVDYTKAFFFDPIFNGACSNDDGGWTMTCTASQTGTSNFYIEAYSGGQTYRSNVIKVSVVDGIFN